MTDAVATAGTQTPDTADAQPTDPTAVGTPPVVAQPTAAPPADGTLLTEEKPATPVVPEVYEFKMPDGFTLDATVAQEFSPIAKEMGLTQEQAQKFADVYAKAQQRQLDTHTEQMSQWVDQVKADKEIGGDKLAENLSIARKAIDTFGGDEVRTLLNDTGFGNHPALIRMAVKIGKAISEDALIRGTQAGVEGDAASRMYPTMK